MKIGNRQSICSTLWWLSFGVVVAVCFIVSTLTNFITSENDFTRHKMKNPFEIQQREEMALPTPALLRPRRFESSPAFRYSSTTRSAPSPDYDPFFKVVSKSRNLFINTIPKVMSSSIHRAIAYLECHGDLFSQCAAASASFAAQQAAVDNLTRVVFLRDPLERAISAYRNSIENQFVYVQHCNSRRQCSFDEWVQALAFNVTATFDNPHFRPQSEIAQLDQMHYHYYLRMSSPLDQHFFWKELIRIDDFQSFASSSPSSSSASFQPYKHYNQASRVSATTTVPTTGKSTTATATTTNTIQGMLQEMTNVNTTLRTLANLYHTDLVIWGQLLQLGTPRQPGEWTLFDYYQQTMMNPHGYSVLRDFAGP